MITVEEFTARVEQAAARQAKTAEYHATLYKELQALGVLAGVTVSKSGDQVYVYRDDEDGTRNVIMAAPIDEVVEALVAPRDDVPFGFFQNLHLGVTTTGPADAGEDGGPVHIERRDLVLLSELMECLSDYLDALA